MKTYAKIDTFHCKGEDDNKIAERHTLNAPAKSSYKYQVVYWFTCQKCGNVLYRWYGIDAQHERTEPFRIRPQDFQLEWEPRLATDKAQKENKDTCFKMHSSELTIKMSKDPATGELKNYARLHYPFLYLIAYGSKDGKCH